MAIAGDAVEVGAWRGTRAARGTVVTDVAALDVSGNAATPRSRSRLAVVILTLNEEVNLPSALESVCGWADRVIVFDSGSTDRTREIADAAGCIVVTHPFTSYGAQRNAAIATAKEHAEWMFFLDADERLTPELRGEIDRVLASSPTENGFYVKRRLIWMGRWIRRGYYPTWILRLARTDHVRCEERSVNEHLIVDGQTGRLREDFVHDDAKGLDEWIAKQTRYARHEAEEFFRHKDAHIPASPFGSQSERTRWVKLSIWNRLPPLVRPCLYFIYRYILRGGFLDGAAGFTYHVLQGFWLQLLIDINYLELRRKRGAAPT
jgi:glycosyltransferase involved in cell wall biosynthesis